MHSGKNFRSALWLNAMHSGKKCWASYIFPLNPDYVAARSLRSLRSNYILEDVSINNEYENDFKPNSYSKSFSHLSMLAMTPSSSL